MDNLTDVMPIDKCLNSNLLLLYLLFHFFFIMIFTWLFLEHYILPDNASSKLKTSPSHRSSGIFFILLLIEQNQYYKKYITMTK